MTTPGTIYLIPDEDEFGPTHYWCADPAPSERCDPAEAVEYVRKDTIKQPDFDLVRIHLHLMLEKVWSREWSADEGLDAIESILTEGEA